MTQQAKPGKRLRRTAKIRDRSGQPVPMVSMREVGKHTGKVLRAAGRHGTLAVTRGGRPVAVMVSADEFLAICVDFTARSIKSRALDLNEV